MPIQKMIEIRKSGNVYAKLALLLATHCAPFLRRMALANVLTVEAMDVAKIRYLLKGTDISFVTLSAKGGKAILYLYREAELMAYLEKEEIVCFLEKHGYSKGDCRKYLWELSKRVRMHGNGEADYPHEIGIFLGYPLEDVTGFIENKGQNFIHMGYWKVYHNARESMQLFRRFDEEREWVVSEVVEGRTLLEIAS